MRAASGAALLLVAAAASADETRPHVPERVAPIAGVNVEVSFVPWTLTSTTPAEIESETISRSPCGKPACTEWNIAPNFPYRAVAGGCGAGAVRTTVTIRYRLPLWRPAKPPTPRMEEWWKANLPEILAHEGGHRDLAVETANRVQEKLAALAPAATCEELGAEAKREALAVIEHGNQLQRDYDARTEKELLARRRR